MNRFLQFESVDVLGKTPVRASRREAFFTIFKIKTMKKLLCLTLILSAFLVTASAPVVKKEGSNDRICRHRCPC